ncbi:MAG: O-antigen ligase family protein [Desulfobacter sp.]|uniref:O-antigen ligase family protein n=1 Tax=Desulfobacter sp. TaxID=2294 RepID=UPI001B7CBF50|nr:O-antigen ligase family protein [Desulfobacter sp.]MBP8830690.1 O-antigen ligase family protein [Desulfobacter sp.]
MKTARFSIFFLIFFTPLAFGTKAPWSYGIMEGMIGAGLFFFALAVIKNQVQTIEVPALVPLLIFLVYILFQVVPLPPGVVKFLSPHAYAIHSRAYELFDAQGWMTLSIHPQSTVFQFFRYASYTAFYLLTIQVLKEKGALQSIALSIAAYGGLLALSSILQLYLTEDMALWFWYTPENSMVMGPYSNHNHYAGLMEMIFPLVLGLFFFYRPRIGETSFIRGIIEILNQEKANIHILIGASALLVIVSIFVSLSRGAIISTCLALSVFSFLLVRRKTNRRNSLLIIGVIMAVALAMGWFGWDQVFERFAKMKNPEGVLYNTRLEFWKDSFQIIKDFFLTGAGFGGFVHIYPPYKSLIDNRVLNYAHNDYIQLLVEGGIIGFSIIAVFMAVFFFKSFKAFSKRRDALCVYLYMGSITGMVSILFHSFTDFNLHIGANGLWFAFLAGLAVSAANTNIRGQHSPTRLVSVEGIFNRRVFTGVSMGFVVAVALFLVSHLGGAFYLAHIKDKEITSQTSEAELDAIQSIARTASAFDPLLSPSRYFEAVAAIRKNNMDQAELLFRTAIHLAPLNSWYLMRFGRFAARNGQAEKAETAFSLAVQYRPTLPAYTLQYGTWLLSTDRIDQGLALLKTTLELDDEYSDTVIRTLLVANVDHERILTAIPRAPGPMFAYADFLYTVGRQSQGQEIYREMLAILGELDNPKISNYWRVYRFFIRQKNIKDAMAALEKAETAIPGYPEFKIELGDLYRRQGILFKAREKYEQALYVDPNNKKARQRLEKMDSQSTEG